MKKGKIKALLLSAVLVCVCGVITANTLFVSATTSVDLPTTTLFTDDSGIVLTEQGLKVNTKSDTATVNGTLSGDLSVEYVYSQSGYGETEFTFYDKDDPTTKVFSLYRSFSEDKNSGCACVVDYRGSDTAEKILYLGARSWENSFPDKYRFQYNGLGSVSSEVYPSCGTIYYNVTGNIQLTWQNDTVTVSVPVGTSGEITSQKTVATLEVPDFKDGYIMKVEGSTLIRNKGGDDSIVIKTINGVSLTDSTVSAAVRDGNGEVYYDGEYVENGKNVIEVVKGEAIGNFSYSAYVEVGSMKLSNPVPIETFAGATDISTSKTGDFQTTVSHLGTSKAYTIRVLPGINATDIFTEESAATFTTVTSGYGAVSGVKVVPRKQTAAFNGVFNGNLELQYAYASAGYGAVEFKFYDKDNDRTPVFSVYKSRYTTQNVAYNNYGNAFVIYEGKYYVFGQGYDTVAEAEAAAVANGDCNFYPANNTSGTGVDKWAVPGKIILEWVDNQVTVKLTTGVGLNIKSVVTMATLTLGDFRDGYTVTIEDSPNIANRQNDDPVVITSINGKSFDKEILAASYSTSGILYEGEETDTIYAFQNGELGKFSAKANTVVYAEGFVGEASAEAVEEGFEANYNADLQSVGSGSVSVTTSLYGAEGETKAYTLVVVPSVAIETCEGAWIRARESMENSGIKFAGYASIADLETLTADENVKNVEVGILITATDYLKGTDFTINALKAADKNYKRLACNEYFNESRIKEGHYEFDASIINILSYNFTLKFSARVYLCVTMQDDAELFLYSAYNQSVNSRSVYEVAKSAYELRSESSEVESILLAYINGFVNINITDGEVSYANASAEYTPAYVANYENGVLTITSATKICLVMVNGKYYRFELNGTAGNYTASVTIPE